MDNATNEPELDVRLHRLERQVKWLFLSIGLLAALVGVQVVLLQSDSVRVAFVDSLTGERMECTGRPCSGIIPISARRD